MALPRRRHGPSLPAHPRLELGGHARSDHDATALNRAVHRQRSAHQLIFHSDRGAEYAAYAYRARLAALGIIQSMKRPRELGDNAFIESFFHPPKADVIHARAFDLDADLRTVVSAYIRHYNRSRLHSGLGYRSPIDYEHAAA